MVNQMSEVLYENKVYKVAVIDDALDEDNSSRVTGYGIFNKETGVREATGLVFGECRWRADQFANMLSQLDDLVDPLAVAAEGADEDVTLN